MKKAIIIIITVLVILVGAFCGLYFFTDTFNFLKPASDNFAMQTKKLMGTDEDPKYSDYEEFLNKLKTNSSNSTDLNMSMNLNLPSSTIDYSTQKLINSSSIKYKGSYDANLKSMLNDIGLYKDDNEVLTLSTIAKDDTLSVSCKDLYDKYLTFDLSEYESFCQANNIEIDEDTKQALASLSKIKDIDSSNLAYDLYYISEEDFNSLHKNYDNILVDLIDEENYTTNKNQKITVDGEEVKTTAYSLTMNTEETIDFANKFIDLVKNDSTLKKLIIEKYDVIKDTSFVSAFYTGFSSATDRSDTATTPTAIEEEELPELTESQIDEFLSDLTKELEDLKDDIENEEQCIKLTIYSNKSSEPVKFEIAVLDDKEDDEGTVIFTEELAEGKNTYTIDLENISKLSDEDSSSNSSSSSNSLYDSNSSSNNSLYSSNTTNSSLSSTTSTLNNLVNSLSEIEIVDSYEKTDDSRKGTVTISAKASGSKQDLIEIEYDTVDSDSESKFNISVTSPLSSSISFDLVSEVTGLDTDNQKVNFSLSGKYSAYSVKFDADGTVKSEAEVTELNDSNSVDVFTLSETDLQQLYTDILTKAADILPSRLSGYGVDLTKEDILSLIPQTTPDNNTTTGDGTATDTNTDATNTENVTDPNTGATTEQPAA